MQILIERADDSGSKWYWVCEIHRNAKEITLEDYFGIDLRAHVFHRTIGRFGLVMPCPLAVQISINSANINR